MTTTVSALGAGSWGTTVAALAAQNGVDVLMWARRPETADEINRLRTNSEYLPGIRLPERLRATADIQEAVTGRDVIVMGVPSHGWRDILRQAKPYLTDADTILSLTKGVEDQTCRRMSEVVAEELPDMPADRYAVLAGPNISSEIVRRLPAATVIACRDERRGTRLQQLFHQSYFRVYTNSDVTGCELGGAIKNIIAIAVGMTEQFGLGDNATAALMTRGLAELTRLGVRLGGDPMTFAGLAGMGDMVVTCISQHSRNRAVGCELGKGRPIDEITSEMQMVAEGVSTCRPVLELSRRVGAAMPITAGVVSVIYDGVTPAQMLTDILNRPPAAETYA